MLLGALTSDQAVFRLPLSAINAQSSEVKNVIAADNTRREGVGSAERRGDAGD